MGTRDGTVTLLAAEAPLVVDARRLADRQLEAHAWFWFELVAAGIARRQGRGDDDVAQARDGRQVDVRRTILR